jgi:hypothetical protein
LRSSLSSGIARCVSMGFRGFREGRP